MTAELTIERWTLACRLFEAALDHAEPDRGAWLQTQCIEDDLRRLVQAMLDADAAGIDEPPVAAAAFPECVDSSWPPGLELGPYRIERRLGQGGMGEVYLAQRCDGTVNQQVAIKRLRSSLQHAELERRFLTERRILARLVHPHIARFLDAGSAGDGQPYAVIEYVDGIPITDHVQQSGMDTQARLRLFLRVAEGVDHAHRQLIVHRDIKPGNVLVAGDGSPRLLDFGIAKVLDGDGEPSRPRSAADHTDLESRAFSLAHAAPEQLRGEPAGVACDVYALGVLLYQLLTDRLPLVTDGLAYGEAERLILNRAPAAPSSVAPNRGLRGDLDRIVLHALKKEPVDRYPTVAALCADLQRHLQCQPISLRRHHRWYQLRLLLRRHPIPIGLGLGLLTTILVGSALLYRQSLVLTAQRDQARAAMGLMQSAFRATNPLQIEDAEITLSQFLAAARPELEQRFAAQPRLYAELAGTLADVELASGQGAQARALAERAWQAWARAPDDPILGEALTLLRARAALAASDYETVEQLLPDGAAGQRLEWQLLQARLLGHQGDYAAAAAMLTPLLARYDGLDPTDELAGDLRRQAAQAQRFLGNDAAALALIDQTIAWQRQGLPADHPRLILSRLYRLGPLSAQSGPEVALAESEDLLQAIERSFGADSTVHAAALSAVASTLNQAGRLEEAANTYARALVSWRRAAGDQHQNTLRTAFNLAQLRAAQDPADPRIESLYREVVERGEATLGQERHAVMFWRLSWAEYELQRGRLRAAADLITARLPLLQSPRGVRFLDRFLENADLAWQRHCGTEPGHGDCLAFAATLAALRAHTPSTTTPAATMAEGTIPPGESR